MRVRFIGSCDLRGGFRGWWFDVWAWCAGGRTGEAAPLGAGRSGEEASSWCYHRRGLSMSCGRDCGDSRAVVVLVMVIL